MTSGSHAPTRRVERGLLRAGHSLVAGVDEVGRGALAGPVSVGVVVVDAATRAAPPGLRDSKLLTPAAREALCAPIRRWALAGAVGHASAAEIDAVGIVAALRMAATRALAELAAAGARPTAVILDGSHNWLAAPAQRPLFGGDGTTGITADPPPGGAAELEPAPESELVTDLAEPTVHVRVKADRTCAVVAAASVLAKCERDALMTALDLEHAPYGWAVNKGYAVPEHLAALRALGPSPLHRVSWRLPTRSAAGGAREGVSAGGMMAP